MANMTYQRALDVIGVHIGASDEEVKKAYRKLAREHHPDLYSSAPEQERLWHEQMTKEINEAYDLLCKNPPAAAVSLLRHESLFTFVNT